MSWVPATSLLYPRWRGFVNSAGKLDSNGWSWVAGSGALIALVWIGIFFGIRELLEACYRIELFGEFLVDRLLSLFFLSFTGILLFSNVVTSLASFYLSDDLPIVNAAPIDRLRIFYARLVETVAGSSWMVVVFGAPVLLAYGVVHDAGPAYYLLALAVGPLYFLIPAAIGVVATTLLVNIFPARRARDLLMILGVVFLGLAFLMFRAIRPERLVDPNAFANLAQFFGALAVPDSAWLPSTWATRALGLAMRGRAGWAAPAGTLALTSAALVFLSAWITSALYFSGWSKAQEGRRATLNRFQGEWLHRMAVRTLGARAGAILAKDARTFFRDAGQWSQLLLLLALVAIYLMSIKALPFDVLTFDTTTYRNAVAYLNLGMGGFVLAAVSARFLFPAVSAEGRAIWIVRAAPMGARDLVRAKFAGGLIPILIVGEVISLSSSYLLRVSPFVMWSGAATTAVLAVAISALAVGLGAQMPDFKAENLAKVASGFGGVLYMASALVYVGVVVLLEAYPTWLFYDSMQYRYSLGMRRIALSVGCYLAAILFSGVVAWVSLERGAKSLEEREFA